MGICRRLFTRRNYLIKHLSKEHPRELTSSNNLVDFSRIIPFHPVAKRLINPNIHREHSTNKNKEDDYSNYEGETSIVNYSNIYIENEETYISEKMESVETIATDEIMQMYPEEEEEEINSIYAIENRNFNNEYSVFLFI